MFKIFPSAKDYIDTSNSPNTEHFDSWHWNNLTFYLKLMRPNEQRSLGGSIGERIQVSTRVYDPVHRSFPRKLLKEAAPGLSERRAKDVRVALNFYFLISRETSSRVLSILFLSTCLILAHRCVIQGRFVNLILLTALEKSVNFLSLGSFRMDVSLKSGIHKCIIFRYRSTLKIKQIYI